MRSEEIPVEVGLDVDPPDRLRFFSDQLEGGGEEALPAAAFVTFAVVAMVSLGSLAGGVIADRWGRTNTTSLMLTISGLCSLGIGLLYGGPTWLIVIVGMIWGSRS